MTSSSSLTLQKNINEQYPLHCIIESRCIENLKDVESLFSYAAPNLEQFDSTHKIKFSPYVNVKNESGENCLHTLAESLTNESYNIIFPMMQILLAHGCNANYPNCDGKSPFFIVLEKLPQLKTRKEIAEYFIKNGDLDFYTHRSEEIVELVMNQKVKYVNELPEEEEFTVNFESMLQLMRDNEINKFETKFSLFKATCEDMDEYGESCSAFLEMAVYRNLINIVDLLISFGVDINRVSKASRSKIPPPFLACKTANVGILRSFLLRPEIKLYFTNEGNRKTLLHQFFDDFKMQSYSVYKKSSSLRELTRDQKKCFNLVLQHEKCDREIINAHDEAGLPAIYYSVRYKIDLITIELLKNGAYIGTVINGIRKSLLTDFLDSCITTNDRYYDDEEFEIKINYGFLMPTKSVISRRKFRKLTGKDSSFLPISQKSPEDFTALVDACEIKHSEEMKPLKKIADNVELQRFLMHPVLSSFILLKWNKINFLIYINLVLILMYMFSFIPFIVLCQTNVEENERAASFAYNLFYILSFISLSFIIIRESMQLFLSVKQYLSSSSNWIDMALILASITILLFEDQIPNHISRMLRTIIILLAVSEYFNLLGLLPLLSISLHTKMFKKVCMTFIKSLAFYSVMILAFAFSFYTLHGDKFAKDLLKMEREGGSNATNNNIPVTNATRNERYNNFYYVGLSIVKSFVMLSGELEAGYIHLEGFSYAALFLLFLFLVTIVLYNLLNALAVSDTQEIKSDAKLIDLHQRILTMHESEEAVFKRNSRIGDWCKKIISMFPKTIPDGVITFKPNRSSHLFVRQTEPIILNDWLPHGMKFLKNNVKINSEIIQDIRKLLAKKREERIVNAVRKLKESRNEKLANDIIKINEMISDIQQNVVKLQSDLYSIKKRVNL